MSEGKVIDLARALADTAEGLAPSLFPSLTRPIEIVQVVLEGADRMRHTLSGEQLRLAARGAAAGAAAYQASKLAGMREAIRKAINDNASNWETDDTDIDDATKAVMEVVLARWPQ